MASINSVLTYNANLSPAQAQLKALTGQVGALTAAFNTLDKSAVRAQGALASTFLANVGQIGGFTTQMVQSGTAVDNFGKALSKQRLTMRQYFREAFAGYTKQNSMMKQLAAQQVRMQQSMMVPMGAGPGGTGRAAVLTPTSVGAMGTAAAMASQKFSIFNELVRGGSERLLNFGKNTQWTGRQLMVGFTLPLVLFTGLVSKQFREIDKELTRFEKVYGGDLVNTVEGATEKMREQVKQLAYDISSSYGIAAKETAALAADIAQTGREGEDLIASVKQTTRLAVLGEVERQEAMRATLSIQNAFKLNTNELSEAIDFLNAVENQTSTNLQDLAGAIPRVGPVIQALGGDIKDMSLLLVAMREGGVSAGEAANALKSGLGRLINPTKRARDVAASFGISLEDIIQNSKGELLPMIFGLQDALNGINEFGRAQVLEKVFGKYQFARMAALFANLRRQGSQTLSVMELASASSSELAGIANKELRALQESSSMRFQRTIENLKNSLIPLGNMLTETLIPVLSAIGGGIKSFMEFFQNLPGPIQNFTKYAIALTAIAGPVVMLVGLFGNLIANGIKFSMMIVRLGAKAAGLRFEKFELLTADVIAARQGVDNLTTSFVTQETALKRLVSVMSTYSVNLAQMMKTNPQLFAAGATPRVTPLIRRQKGSRSPEVVPGGYGGGDKIPALLEPGEFVVRKEAASKYGPILASMNRGDIQGFENGTPSGRDAFRGSTVSRNKSGAGIPLMLGPNQAARGILMPFDKVVASSANLIGLFYKDIAKSAGVSLSAVKRETASWQRQAENRKLISDFVQMMASDTATQEEKTKALAALETKYVSDMTKAKGATYKFAQEAAKFEKENGQILKRAQQILIKHNVDLTDAASITNFYKNNLRDLSHITDKTELAAMQLLKNTMTAGNYRNLTMATSAALPLMPGKRDYGTTGYPIQYIPPVVRNIRTEQAAMRQYKLNPQQVALVRQISMSAEHTINTLNQIANNAAGGLANLTKKTMLQAKKLLGISSPSREVESMATSIGVGIAQGAMNGLRKGMMSATAAPVSPIGPGLESRTLRSQIATKEQSILKFTEMQEKAARSRTIAEGQILNIQLEHAKIMKRTDITLAEKLRLTESLRNQLVEQQLIVKNSILIEKRASDNVAQAKNDLAALIRRTPPPAFFTPGMATAGTAGAVSGLALMGGMAGTKTATSNTLGIVSTGRPSSPTMMVSGSRTGGGATTSVGRSGTVSVQGLRPTSPTTAASTGPTASIRSAQESAARQPGMGGMGAMNALFMLSMITSSFAMLGGQSNDLSMKLGILTSAVMAASMAMMMFSGRNVMGNFLGLRSLGGKISSRATPAPFAPTAAGAAAAKSAGFSGAGPAMLKLGRAVSLLGGPAGIAAGLVLTGLVTTFMILKKRAEEARERLISAFADPTKTAEYFGQSIEDVNKTIEMNKMANITTDMDEVSEDLRKVVKEDYQKLIDRLQETTSIIGARDLSVAFASMITSGISAENARAAIEAIAVEAGEKGGKAFAEAMGSNILNIETVQDAVSIIAGQFDPRKNKELDESIKQYQDRLTELESERESLITTAEERQTQPSSGRTPRTIRPEGRGSVQLTQEEFRRYADIQKEVDEIKKSLEEIFNISPDKLIPSVEQLIMAYSEAPREVGQALSTIETEILSSTENQGEYFKQIKDFLNKTYSEDMAKYGAGIDTIEEAVAALKLVTSGVSLNRAVDSADQFNLALANSISRAKTLADITSQLRLEAEQEYFGMIDEFFGTRRIEIQADLDVLEEDLSNLTSDLQAEYFGEGQFAPGTDIEIRNPLEARERELELSRRATEEQNRLAEERIDLIEEEKEAQEEKYDEEIEALENEKEAIQNSTEAYINSIEKRQRADNFYANQRKTAFSALEKLASGDVFGFLQEREQMSQDAQQFAYDEQIKSIEEREDRELELIDNAIDARRKEHEEYKKMMDERIELERDQIDERNKAREAEQRHHEQRLDEYNEDLLVATAKSEARKIQLQNELNFISDGENEYRENSLVAEGKFSKDYSELKTAPYVEARKEFMKLRVEEIFFRGGVTLAEAIRQAGYGGFESSLTVDTRARQMAEIARELGILIPDGPGGGPSRDFRLATPGDTYVIPGGTLPDTGVVPPFNAEDVTIQDPQNVYINGVDVGDNGQTNYDGTPDRDGNPQTLDQAAGGYISGPGTATSDSIPARLSNGEYVIRASSVSKYGKGMMDAINEARFADGGYVDAGARRAMAEGKIPYQTRSVSNNLANQVGGYAGQVMRQPYQGVSKPGQKTNNTPYMGVPNSLILPQHLTPSMGIDINSQVNPVAEYANNPGSFVIDSLLGIKDDIADFVWHMFSDENEQVANRFGSFIRGMTEEEYSRISDDEKRIGAIFGASTFLPIPGVAGIRGIAAGVRSGIRAGSLSRAGGAGLKSSLSNAYASARSASKSRPNRFDPQYQEGVDPEEVIVNYLNSLPDKELPPGVRPFYVGKTVSPEVQSAYNKFLAHYVYKNADAQGVTRDIFWGKHSNLINMKNAVPEEGYIFGSDPNMDKFILQFYPSYKEGVPVNKVAWDDLVDSIFGGQGFGAGFDDPVKQLQVNSTRGSNPILELLGVSAHEGGHAIDFTNYYSLTDKRFLINPTERHQGIAEAAAEGNRIKVISELYKDAGLSAGHHNIIPYFKGYRGQANYGNTPSFKRTFLYNSLKNAFNKNSPFYWGNELSTAQKTRGLLRIARDAASSTFNYPYKFGILSAVEKNRRMRGVPPLTKNQALAGQLLFNSMQTLAGLGSVVNPILIKNLIDYLSTDDSPEMRMNIAEGFAEGGFVGKANPKFVSGMQLPSLIRSTQPDASASPGSSIYGGAARPTPTPSTNTSLIDHPSQGGPNGWPYSGFQTATGTIPGTGKKITMNKDVLPLFLAFASDYNRLIRPIDYVGGLAGRSGTFSNHPSGTAIDINANQEGVYFGWDWVPDDRKRAVLNWWKGQESPLANWSSPSSVPYKTVNDLMNKYKILQWFGPRSLGGFINDEMGNSDPMHFQITQSRRVSPGEVANTISSLGIRPDGTFNYAMGGFVSGPGGPRSDSIPARLSNGEYVVRASAVDKYGKGMLDQINSGQFGPSPKMFASGGMVGGMGYTQGGMVSPAFDVPSNNISMGGSSVVAARNTENFNNNSNVKIVINGANGNAQAIANKVVRMINQANNRRNHSRSTA